MFEICIKNKCTGCGACLNICHKAAIDMQEDDWGFKYPIINQNICVDCGLCHDVCPNNLRLEFHNPISAFIAKAVNLQEQKSSVSGGVASAFSRFIIKSGGVVYGCTGIDGKHVKHIRVDKEAELIALKGSKYVQSDMNTVHQLVKKDLVSGKEVLVIGTPCQTAGLISFLQKSYKNLYTIDFVCHGVPSQRLLNSGIKTYTKGKETYSIGFRKKAESGKSYYGVFVHEGNENKIARYFPNDLYIVGFLQGLYYRNSCYTCDYTKKNRVSDITVGDYWDREKRYENLNNSKFGLSMLMVNTKKGETLFNRCQHVLDFREGDLNAFIKRNGQLEQPMKKHPMYDFFRNEYLLYGFQHAASNCLVEDVKRIKRTLFITHVSSVIYKIPFMRRLFKFIRSR